VPGYALLTWVSCNNRILPDVRVVSLIVTVEPTRLSIRQWAVNQGIQPAVLAKACGLGRNTLRALYRSEWSPTAKTLEKLADYINLRNSQDGD
jgi:hypothetical protein